MQISSIRIQRARSEREKFRSAQSQRFYFFGSSFTDKMIRAQSPITRSNIGEVGLLRWAPKIPSSPFVNRCTMLVIPNWWVSGGSIYIHLHCRAPPAPSRNTYCRILRRRTHIVRKFLRCLVVCDLTMLLKNFAVLSWAFLHFVTAVKVTFSTPTPALLNRGFVIHFSV